MAIRPKILAIIPARAGSKRIPNKNIRNFLGKPLLAYAISQAKKYSLIDRVVVDTDSSKIAAIAQKFKAEVLYLRPAHLATDNARIADSVIYMLDWLEKNEGYVPTHILLLQTTSPLREKEDIANCWQLMEESGATTVLTVCQTHPRLYHLDKRNTIELVNGSESQSTNMQAWPAAYILNGCFVYIVEREAFLREKNIITKDTRAVICPKWRSVDLDTPEEWAMAEVLYRNRKHIAAKIKKMGHYAGR